MGSQAGPRHHQTRAGWLRARASPAAVVLSVCTWEIGISSPALRYHVQLKSVNDLTWDMS